MQTSWQTIAGEQRIRFAGTYPNEIMLREEVFDQGNRMSKDHQKTNPVASCHCGAITIELPHAPLEITHCNCTLCRRYGVLWAYYSIAEVKFEPMPLPTDTYAWNRKNVDFHRCKNCGCVTHWYPRSSSRQQLGLNARLLDPDVLSAAEVRYKDSAKTGKFQ